MMRRVSSTHSVSHSSFTAPGSSSADERRSRRGPGRNRRPRPRAPRPIVLAIAPLLCLPSALQSLPRALPRRRQLRRRDQPRPRRRNARRRPRCKFCYLRQAACNESAPPHGSVAIAGCRSHGLRLLNVTTNASSSPKVLAVGSTLYTARPGDVVIGAGAKELQKGWALAHENASCADARLKRVCERHRAAGTCASAGAWGCKRTCRGAASPRPRRPRPPRQTRPGCRPSTGAACGSPACAARGRAPPAAPTPPAAAAASPTRARRTPAARRGRTAPLIVPPTRPPSSASSRTLPIARCSRCTPADRRGGARAERLRECRAQPDAAACRSISQVRPSTTRSRAAGSRSRWRARCSHATSSSRRRCMGSSLPMRCASPACGSLAARERRPHVAAAIQVLRLL